MFHSIFTLIFFRQGTAFSLTSLPSFFFWGGGQLELRMFKMFGNCDLRSQNVCDSEMYMNSHKSGRQKTKKYISYLFVKRIKFDILDFINN